MADMREPWQCPHYHGPYICIYITEPKPTEKHVRIERALASFHAHELAVLYHLDAMGHDLNHLIRVMQVIDRYNAYSAREVGQKHQTTPYAITAATGSVPDFAGTFDATRARITSLAEEFTKRMASLNEKQILFYNATGKDAKHAAKAAYQQAYRSAMEVVNRNTKLAFLSQDTERYLRTASHTLKMGGRKGVWVNDLKDVQTLKRIAKYGKTLGWGIFGFTVAKDYRDVMITRKEGGDWQREAAGDAGEVTGQLAGSAVAEGGLDVVALCIPGLGWGFLAISIGVELLFMLSGGDMGKWLGGRIEQFMHTGIK